MTMDWAFVVSTAIMLLMVLDPLGNLVFFIQQLRRYDAKQYVWIVFRESLIALGVLLIFLLFGGDLLKWIQVSPVSLEITGGLVLFIIALKMIFGWSMMSDELMEKEPFIVPLAVPMIAGPSTMAVTILLRSPGTGGSLAATGLALFLAWGVSMGILMCGRWLKQLLGEKVLDAREALMGLLLTAIAVEMLVRGIRTALRA